MKSTETAFFVLPEGATQEEKWDWETIEEMCRTGELTAETRIFFPDKNKWVPAGETELNGLFPGGGAAAPRKAVAAEEAADPAESEGLQTEYQEAIRRVGRQPQDANAHVEAGRLAAEIGDRDAARAHFQKALDLKPFNSRVANEVMRRFSKSECREFLYLRRDLPVWDDLADLVTYPMSGGVLYLAIPAAVLFVLSLIPFGDFVAAPLAFLWLVQVGRQVAAGETQPPRWQAPFANPAREIVLPLLAGALVVAECALVVYGLGRLGMLTSGESGSVILFVSGSPVLSVALTVLALVYLPAVLVKIIHSVGIIVHLLNPISVVRSMIRMEQEYAISALIVLLIGGMIGGLNFFVGGVPVLGKAVLALLAAVAIPVVGLVLGRLAGRMRHVL